MSQIRGSSKIQISKLVKFIPGPIRNCLNRVFLPILIRRAWFKRRVTAFDDHLNLYWDSDDSETRLQMVSIIQNLVNSFNEKTIRMVEYGSHVGVNLKLIQHACPTTDFKMTAIEPNLEACKFLKTKLPEVEVIQGGESAFLRMTNDIQFKFHLSLVNSVFYSMSGFKTKKVIRRLCEISDLIVVGDSMVNLNGSKLTFNSEPIFFSHPYRKIFNYFGFEIIETIPAVDFQPQLDGFIVARKI
jgi:hypothetical protein